MCHSISHLNSEIYKYKECKYKEKNDMSKNAGINNGPKMIVSMANI